MGKTHVQEELVVVEVVEEEEVQRRCRFRPLAFLLSLPFILCAAILSIAAGIVWILGYLLSYVCPCLSFCADFSNKAMELLRLPLDVMRSFFDLVPC